MQNSLYKLFEHKCVLEVCVHIHPIMIKIHPVFFFIPILKCPSSNQAVLRFLSERCSSAQTAPRRVDWQAVLPLTRPEWTEWAEWAVNSPTAIVSTPVQGKTRMPPIKWLRCSVVGCNNEYSSRHLLPSSEPLKTQRINVTFNASMFAQIIRDRGFICTVNKMLLFLLNIFGSCGCQNNFVQNTEKL